MIKMAVKKWVDQMIPSVFTVKPPETPIATNCISRLQEAIEILNDNQYTALMMWFEGYSHKEIAAQLKVSLKEVKKNISLGNSCLKFHLLAKYDFTLSNMDWFKDIRPPEIHQL